MSLRDFADLGQAAAPLLTIAGVILFAAWWIVTSILKVQHQLEVMDARTSGWRGEAKDNLAAVDKKVEWGFKGVNKRLDTLNGQVAKNTERSIRNEVSLSERQRVQERGTQ